MNVTQFAWDFLEWSNWFSDRKQKKNQPNRDFIKPLFIMALSNEPNDLIEITFNDISANVHNEKCISIFMMSRVNSEH